MYVTEKLYLNLGLLADCSIYFKDMIHSISLYPLVTRLSATIINDIITNPIKDYLVTVIIIDNLSIFEYQ